MKHKWKIQPRGKITKYYICQRCDLRIVGCSLKEVNKSYPLCSNKKH